MSTGRIIDLAQLVVEGGTGGSGCVAFKRSRGLPWGGPCGGDGGDGGSVIFVVDHNKRTLLDFQYQRRYAAERGEHGLGKEKTGRSAEDVVVAVPPGTILRDAATGEVIGDMTAHGDRLVVAKGGHGGKGNMRFATAQNRAPREWHPGEPGERREIILELKLIADAGLVGLPNAGKSTLLSRVSAARPKIADYPFTTLEPHLGVVAVGDYSSFVLADIPGIIEGASEGRGLGHDFLRHIERTRVLVFVIDAAGDDPEATLATLQHELHAHDAVLASRPAIVALSKIDTVDRDTPFPARIGELLAYPISGVTGEGVPALVSAVFRMLKDAEVPDAAAAS